MRCGGSLAELNETNERTSRTRRRRDQEKMNGAHTWGREWVFCFVKKSGWRKAEKYRRRRRCRFVLYDNIRNCLVCKLENCVDWVDCGVGIGKGKPTYSEMLYCGIDVVNNHLYFPEIRPEDAQCDASLNNYLWHRLNIKVSKGWKPGKLKRAGPYGACLTTIRNITQAPKQSSRAPTRADYVEVHKKQEIPNYYFLTRPYFRWPKVGLGF